MNEYSPFSYQIFPPEYFEKKAVRKTALLVGVLIFLYVLTSFYAEFLIIAVASLFNLNTYTTQVAQENAEQIIFMLTYALTMIIPFGIYALLTKIPLKVAFPMRKPRPSLALPAVPLTLGVSVIGIFLSGLMLTFFSIFNLSYDVPAMPTPTTTVAKILHLISMSVLPAVFEELAFRGILMQSLRRHGDTFALVTSAVVFSLFHGNLLQLPNTFILGLLIGFFVLRTDSLITGMLMHFFNNFIITVVDMFLISNLSEVEGDFVTLALLGTYVLIGVAALAYYLVKKIEIFKLFPSYTYLPTSKKLAAFFTQPLLIVAMGIMGILCLAFFAI